MLTPPQRNPLALPSGAELKQHWVFTATQRAYMSVGWVVLHQCIYTERMDGVLLMMNTPCHWALSWNGNVPPHTHTSEKQNGCIFLHGSSYVLFIVDMFVSWELLLERPLWSVVVMQCQNTRIGGVSALLVIVTEKHKHYVNYLTEAQWQLIIISPKRFLNHHQETIQRCCHRDPSAVSLLLRCGVSYSDNQYLVPVSSC